jgi:hypothetical protein
VSATASEVCYYEMDKIRAIRCVPEEPGITAPANNVMAPEWSLSPKMPDRVGLYSPLRRGHFFDHFKKDPSTNDDEKMRKYLIHGHRIHVRHQALMTAAAVAVALASPAAVWPLPQN